MMKPSRLQSCLLKQPFSESFKSDTVVGFVMVSERI